jgi:hypothetical protein
LRFSARSFAATCERQGALGLTVSAAARRSSHASEQRKMGEDKSEIESPDLFRHAMHDRTARDIL